MVYSAKIFDLVNCQSNFTNHQQERIIHMLSNVRHESKVNTNGRSAVCGYAKAEERNHPVAVVIFIIILAALTAEFVIIPWKNRTKTAEVTSVQVLPLTYIEEARVEKTLLALKAWTESSESRSKVMDETIRQMTDAVTSEIYWHQTNEKERKVLREVIEGKERKNIPIPSGLQESLAKLGDFEASIPHLWNKDFNLPSTLSRLEADKIKTAAGKTVYEKFKRWRADEEDVTRYVLGIVPSRATPLPPQIKKKR